MILSIILIMDFLRRMSFGLLPKLSNPLVIPHPTYICTLVLTLTVTLGYGYIFVSLFFYQFEAWLSWNTDKILGL